MIDGSERLLHLDSSADAPGSSVSATLTAAYAEVWRDVHGGGVHVHRDLTRDPVPLMNEAYVRLSQRAQEHGLPPLARIGDLAADEAEQREWALTLPLIEEVLAAGTVLIGVPMYNFTISAPLKAWIDRVTFPGAFTRDDLRRTRVVVVAAHGGCYRPGTPREGCDFQTPYLRAYFGHLGIAEENLHVVRAEMTRARFVPELAKFRDLAERSLKEAGERMRELALK